MRTGTAPAGGVLAVLLLAATALAVLPSCASRVAARSFAPASADDARRALEAWRAARERAEALPASRLLYDARMGSRGVAVIPGTLAVSYDGSRVERASLTGPFGASVAEYREGTVTGDDRRAIIVDPEALRSVLAGTWPGTPEAVAGCNGDDCLLTWDGEIEAAAVVDTASGRVRTLQLSGGGRRLDVTYDGEARPWPERIAMREEGSGRSLRLLLMAVEPGTAAATPDPGR